MSLFFFDLGLVQTPLHSCAEPNGATLARHLIQTTHRVSKLIFISCREKEKGLGPISYLRAIIQLLKMVAVKERIALIRAISRGNERRRMFSESAQMLIALRRRRIALLLSLAGILLLSRKQNLATEMVHVRSCRRLLRSNGWWEMVWTTYTNERFKKTFRISKNTFSFILNRIRNDLERQTVNEDPISPECRLGICLYRLGRGDYYYTIAEMAGLGVSTVHEIVTQVCQSIVENLWEDCVKKHMPCSEEDFKDKMKEMNKRWQFPFCWAAIAHKVVDVNIGPLIIGDSAFPFKPWLLKPYTNAVLTEKQRYFNYRLSRARMVTEGAYGQLKGRWRVLLRKNERTFSSQNNNPCLHGFAQHLH